MNSYVITIIATTIGCLIYGMGVNLFFVPHHFLSGGIAGIAMMIYYLTGLPIGTMNILLNIPILFMALRYMGKFYLIITIYGTVMLSFFIDSLSFLSTLSVIKDPVLSAISGGVLMGLGCGILYRYNGNGGGMDVVAAIMKKYYNLEMGTVLFSMNCMIVAAGAVVFTLELAVCTLIGMYIASNVINRVVIGWDQRKAAFIVSEKPMEISDSIIRHIGHGATLLHGQGAFTGKEKEILFTIINLTQISRMKQLIRTIDPNAFLFIMNTTDVIGRGFTIPTLTGNTLPMSHRYKRGMDGKIIPTGEWENQMKTEKIHGPANLPSSDSEDPQNSSNGRNPS